jgi:spore germination protein YaaH
MATKNETLKQVARLGQTALALLLAAGYLQAGQTPRPGKAAGKQAISLSAARQRVMSRRPLAMYYYYDDTRGLKSLSEHAAEVTVVGPQCFWVDADGVVHGETPRGVTEAAQRARLPVMPLLINPGFDRPLASAMLRNPKAQERAVTYLAYLAKRDNYVGWQLDLEFIDPADKSLYTKFVQRAAARLHRDGRLLSIAVVPRFSDDYPDTRAAEFRTGEWGAPYDFRAIGRAVDFMVLMTYDHHGSSTPPGPVAGHAWMKEALEYAVRRVPRQKLLLGIPFYGRKWVETASGTLSRLVTYGDISPLLARPGLVIEWDKRWRAPWFQYREASELHTVWYDDSRSYKEKLQLVREYRLRGFAAWRLGTEDPQFWSVAAAATKPTAVGWRGRGKSQPRARSAGSASRLK